MAQVAVLGGGGTGCYIAAELKLRGYSVNLYEEAVYWHENIDGIRKRGGIELTGNGLNGFAVLDKITVDYYGAKSRLRDVANLATPEARLITIQPWDQSLVKVIEKAIRESSLGISPVSDGRVIRLPIPPLSQERRVALGKQVKARAEEARVAVRNIRRDANEVAKKAQKTSDITEDELKDILEQIQKVTDKSIAHIDLLMEDKEKELMSF